MIFRLTDYVRSGTLDNRERGIVRLTLRLEGIQSPVHFQLQGDCLQDLAGCVTEFENPAPLKTPIPPEALPPLTHGVTGDLSASYRRSDKNQRTVENLLYLEWFTDRYEMLLIESSAFNVKVSLPEWDMSPCEEQAQIMTNQQMLRDAVKEWTHRYAEATEDGELPDHHWDKRLREAEAIAIAYQEIFRKYRLNPMGDVRMAFVMSWDEVLDDIAQSEEQGTPCASSNSDMLSLFDILTEQEAQEVQSCMERPLFRQVMELTDMCRHSFSKEVKQSQQQKAEPPAPLDQIFYTIRYITPRILSALLQEKEHGADYGTMAARMAMCMEQIRRASLAIKEGGLLIETDIKEGFLSLQDELNAFRESLVTQSKKSNL